MAPAQRGQTRGDAPQAQPEDDRTDEGVRGAAQGARPDTRERLPVHARAHADGQRGDDPAELRVREAAGDVDRQDHGFEEAGRGAQERDGELHQLAAFDPRRTARQRELHQMPALQTPPARHRKIHRPHDLEHETQRRDPRRFDLDGAAQHAARLRNKYEPEAPRGRFRFYTGTAHPPIPVRSRR